MLVVLGDEFLVEGGSGWYSNHMEIVDLFGVQLTLGGNIGTFMFESRVNVAFCHGVDEGEEVFIVGNWSNLWCV